MSASVETVKVYHLVRGSFRKVFTVGTTGQVEITTFNRGEHNCTRHVSLEEARRIYRENTKEDKTGNDFGKGWERF